MKTTTNATIKKEYYFMGELISEEGIKYNRVDYRTLAKCFDAVLCNDITKLFYNVVNNEYIEPYQENGQIDNQEQIEELEEQLNNQEEKIEELEIKQYEEPEEQIEELLKQQYKELEKIQDKIANLQGQIEELEEQQENEPDIFQYYIISDQGADILKRYTNEIVYYIEYLDIYIWGVTHWGTSWDYVLTDIKPTYYKLIYNDYEIIANYEILEEIAKNADSIINWSNFNNNDIFYNNDGTAYIVEISQKYKHVYLTLK